MGSGHSPLGASSAERWMNCAGSAALIAELKIEPDGDDPEYRRLGTSAHAGLAHCLVNKLAAWEITGDVIEGETVDMTMTGAIQVFLDVARPLQDRSDTVYIERHMAHPDFHPLFFGTVDFSAITWELLSNYATDQNTGVLNVLDFKYGEGIVVEVEWNPQILYYAYGILRMHPSIKHVRMAIIQPRVPWHADGVVRWFELPAEVVIKWAEGTLRPAMVRTATSTDLTPGEWCRFCPAKLVCPVLTALFGAAATADPREIIAWDDAEVARNYPLTAAVKHYIKALEGDAFRRLNSGRLLDGLKLVKKKADRVWKAEAEAILRTRFGDEAFTSPELKSPAKIEAMGEVAKKLVLEYAYKPDSGLTVAPADDNRPAQKVTTLTERFGEAS